MKNCFILSIYYCNGPNPQQVQISTRSSTLLHHLLCTSVTQFSQNCNEHVILGCPCEFSTFQQSNGDISPHHHPPRRASSCPIAFCTLLAQPRIHHHSRQLTHMTPHPPSLFRCISAEMQKYLMPHAPPSSPLHSLPPGMLSLLAQRDHGGSLSRLLLHRRSCSG